MKVTYLNTGLHLTAPFDLRPLVQTLEALGLWCISMEQTTEGRWSAALQTVLQGTNPEISLKTMLSVLESLEDAEQDLWMGCTQRDFDVCFACSNKRRTLRQWLSRETSQRISGVNARLRITLQASNIWGERKRPHARASAKRVVSIIEYLSRISKREAKRWGSMALAVAVGACVALSTLSLLGALLGMGIWSLILGLVAIVFLPLAWRMKQFAEKNMQEAQKKLDVVPLTRANIGNLPASHTLMRASQEPAPSQKAELLRAAQFGQETPADELLRAVQESRLPRAAVRRRSSWPFMASIPKTNSQKMSEGNMRSYGDVEGDEVKTLHLLLKLGADANVKNSAGKTALNIARRKAKSP